MNKEILNKIRNDAGFGWGAAIGLYTHNVTEMWVEYDKDGEECWPSREIMEKFAELIVRECLEQIDLIRDGCEADNEDQQALGADWAGLAVARHFGVEE